MTPRIVYVRSAAEVEQDRLARDQTKHDLDALTKLAATGAASAGEVAAAQERFATAQANLNAAEKSARHRYSPDEIARARAALNDAEAALAAAQHVEAQTSIYAPIAGTIYTLDAAPSEYTEPGKLLVEIADLHQERVRGYFDEPDLGRLAIGQKVRRSFATGRTRHFCRDCWGVGTIHHEPDGTPLRADGAALHPGWEFVSG